MHHNGRQHILTPAEAADIAGELDEHEADTRIETICLAPVIDGARSLSEAASELHEFAEFLRDIERDGWQMIEPADGTHAYVLNESPGKRIFEPELHETA